MFHIYGVFALLKKFKDAHEFSQNKAAILKFILKGKHTITQEFFSYFTALLRIYRQLVHVSDLLCVLILLWVVGVIFDQHKLELVKIKKTWLLKTFSVLIGSSSSRSKNLKDCWQQIKVCLKMLNQTLWGGESNSDRMKKTFRIFFKQTSQRRPMPKRSGVRFTNIKTLLS